MEQNTYTLEYTITHEYCGMRLDHFLIKMLPTRSRTQIQKAITDHRVYIIRTQIQAPLVKAHAKVLLHDKIRIIVPKKTEPNVPFHFSTIFQDDWLWVINKPAGLPVHPAGSFFFNTLLIHIEQRFQKTVFLAHRIDKETSGVLVMAYDPKICARITKQFEKRTTLKEYTAIVYGHTPKTFSTQAPLKRALSSPIRLKMQCTEWNDPEALSAHTDFLTVQHLVHHNQTFSVIQCYPYTGRQHQIRVHLSALGFPIVGDKLYYLTEAESVQFYNFRNLTEATKRKLILQRHALHADTITFTHPYYKTVMTFKSTLSVDLQNFINHSSKAM
jgi:23S rRNA pseudouridine1911/1915/1917 synthase